MTVTAIDGPNIRRTTKRGLSNRNQGVAGWLLHIGSGSGTATEAGTRRNELDVDAVVAGDTRETGRVALADGAELPLRTVAVQLAEDHGGLGRGVLGQVVTSEFVAVRAVDDADVRVADLAERLAAGIGIVDRDREEDALDVRRDGSEVDVDDLVVAFTLTGAVVAGVLDGTVGRLEVVEEDEVLVGDDLLVGPGGDGAGIEVEVGAGGGAYVPAQADGHCRQVRSFLGEGDVSALGQADAHAGSFRSFQRSTYRYRARPVCVTPHPSCWRGVRPYPLCPVPRTTSVART